MGKKQTDSKTASAAAPTLAETLFSATQQKVLHLFFSNPDRSFFASEIIELAGSGTGAVQREIARLVGSGLVNQRQVGRQKHYQVNPGSPIYAELRSIVAKTSGIANVLRSSLRPLADRILLALLYGSFPKGESRSKSDVDLLVVGEGIALEELYSALESAERALRRKINPTLYSAKEFRKRKADRNPFLTKVLNGKTEAVLGNVNAVETA